MLIGCKVRRSRLILSWATRSLWVKTLHICHLLGWVQLTIEIKIQGRAGRDGSFNKVLALPRGGSNYLKAQHGRGTDRRVSGAHRQSSLIQRGRQHSRRWHLKLSSGFTCICTWIHTCTYTYMFVYGGGSTVEEKTGESPGFTLQTI